MEPYKCEPKRKSVEPQVSSRAGSNVWCYCDQCHCEEREIAYLCCKEVAVLGGEKFAVNVNKSSDFTNIGLSVFLKVGISVP